MKDKSDVIDSFFRDYLEREMNINYGAENEDYYEGSEDG